MYKVQLGPYSQDVLVQGNQDAFASFTLSIYDYIDTLKDQIENRPDDCGDGKAPHPVSLITGNVFIDHVDAHLPGLYDDLLLSRSYNSLSGPPAPWTSTTAAPLCGTCG